MFANPRQGLASKELAILLVMVSVIGLLMQVQSGALDLAGLFARPPAAAKSKGRNRSTGGQPTLIASAQGPDLLSLAAERYIPARQDLVAAAKTERARLMRGVGGMDGSTASLLLARLEPQAAAEVLAQLPGRNIARILEAADPELAAGWLGLLLAKELPAVPDELKPAAAEAGLYDNLPELLGKLRAQSSSSATDGENEAETTAAPPEGTPAAESPAAGGEAPPP